MKNAKYLKYFLYVCFGWALLIGTSSCSKKTGCPANQEVANPMDGKKKYKTKSGLIDPKTKKKKSRG